MHVLGYCSMFGSCTLISVIICGGRPYDSPQVSKWGWSLVSWLLFLTVGYPAKFGSSYYTVCDTYNRQTNRDSDILRHCASHRRNTNHAGRHLRHPRHHDQSSCSTGATAAASESENATPLSYDSATLMSSTRPASMQTPTPMSAIVYLTATIEYVVQCYLSRLQCEPRAGSGVVRIDPLHFLTRCRTRRLNQTLFALSLSLNYVLSMCSVLLTRASFYVVLFFCYLCILSLGCSC